MAIDDALSRSQRKNSFGDAAAAMSNPGVTQVQTAAPAAPQSAAARMAALPGAAPATPTAPSASVGTSAREQMSTLPGSQPTAPKPMPAAVQPDPVAAHNQKLAAAQELQSWQQAPSTSASPADNQAARKNYLELQQKSVDMQPSYFTQEGPMTAKNRASAESAASNALQSMYAPQKPAPTSTTAQSAGEQMATLPAGAGAGRGVINPDSVNPAAPPPQSQAAMAMQSIGDVKREGNSYSGTNVSGDITINGQAPRNSGQVSTENMAAADALGARSAAQAMMHLPSDPGAVPRGVQAPTVAHSGNSWSAQNALRNAQVSASSIMNNGGSWDKHKGVSPERAYAAAMENADFAARGAQAGMNQAAMRENAAIQREGMQQAGSTARAQMMEVGQNNRFGQTQGLARDKLSMEQETQGFSNRAAAQSEQLRNQIMQEKDPAKRQSAVQRMREMQGQTQPSEWGVQVTPTTKNVDGSTSMGSIVRYNKATGQTEVVQQPGQGGAAIPQAGAVQGGYRFKGGDPSKQTSWEKV